MIHPESQPLSEGVTKVIGLTMAQLGILPDQQHYKREAKEFCIVSLAAIRQHDKEREEEVKEMAEFLSEFTEELRGDWAWKIGYPRYNRDFDLLDRAAELAAKYSAPATETT